MFIVDHLIYVLPSTSFSCPIWVLSYYPSGAVEISDNRLFGMFHAQTPQHDKDVILSSMQKDGIVRVVFATVALGMGVNFVGLNRVIHYGTPSSIEDYFQECGRADRSGDPAKSSMEAFRCTTEEECIRPPKC